MHQDEDTDQERGEVCARLADSAAEAIRSLNHTLHALDYPSDLSSIAVSLKTLAYRLPQALAQIEASLSTLHRQGALRSDRGRAASEEVASVTAGLRVATCDAEQLAEHLTHVHNALSHIGGYPA